MKSADGGSVWKVSDTLYDSYGDIVADPNDDFVFWSGGNDWNGSAYIPVVSKTEDIGETWIRFPLSDSGGMINCLAIHPSNSDIIFAGGYDGSFPSIFKTADGGSTWIDASSGITGVVNDIVIDPDSNGIMYAGTDVGVFKSTDGAESWINTGLTYVNDLLIDRLIPTTIIAATNSGVYTTTNAGRDWQPMNDGLDSVAVTCLEIYPNVYLYAGTYGSGLYRMEWLLGRDECTDHSAEQRMFCAYPNPVHNHVTFSYVLRHAASIQLAVYDIQGRLVRELVNMDMKPGSYSTNWNGHDVRGNAIASGVYFCTLTLDSGTYVEKIAVVK